MSGALAAKADFYVEGFAEGLVGGEGGGYQEGLVEEVLHFAFTTFRFERPPRLGLVDAGKSNDRADTLPYLLCRLLYQQTAVALVAADEEGQTMHQPQCKKRSTRARVFSESLPMSARRVRSSKARSCLMMPSMSAGAKMPSCS